MFEIALGLAAFGLLCVYDYAKMKGIQRGVFVLFFGALFLLVFATARLTDFPRIFSGQGVFRWAFPVFFALSLLFFTGTVYSLFFALPFAKTYGKAEHSDVVDTGLYALCRHPGVLFLILGYFFLWLAAGGTALLLAFLLFSLADIGHVFLQDRFFFPPVLKGYDRYQKTTPFLWPNRQSIRAFRGKGRA